MKHIRTFVDAVIVAVVMVLLVGAGMGGVPQQLTDAVDRIRPGIRLRSYRGVFDANTTTATIKTASGGSVHACFPDRMGLHLVANAEATCCFTLGFEATIGSQTTDAATTITDSGPVGNGIGACHTFPAAGEWYTTVDLGRLRMAPGARAGVCSNAVSLPSNRVRVEVAARPPCDADADCTAAGAPAGTTCVLATSDPAVTAADYDASCTFVTCRAVSANTDVNVEADI